jgi:hypothetical protein
MILPQLVRFISVLEGDPYILYKVYSSLSFDLCQDSVFFAFFKLLFLQKVWWDEKLVVPLHPLSR